MRFEIDTDFIQIVFSVLVFAILFAGAKLKNFFESIENEESHKRGASSSQDKPAPPRRNTAFPNRGANYREVPKRRDSQRRREPALEEDIFGGVFVGKADTLEKLSDAMSEHKSRPSMKASNVEGGAGADSQKAPNLVGLREALADRDSLARAVLLSEILDKPLALRGGKLNSL